MNENGDVLVEAGTSVPAPFSANVTLVALPPNVLPLTVIGVVPQVLPLVLLSVTVGGFAQPQETEKVGLTVTHPNEFLTLIK